VPAVAGGPSMVLELPFDEAGGQDADDWSGSGNDGRSRVKILRSLVS